jgi:Phage tail assembly chaperone protein, TAC
MTFRQLALQHGSWAMGVLGWSPCDFWGARPADVQLAWRGWCALHGLPEADTACDRATFDALRLQFPD